MVASAPGEASLSLIIALKAGLHVCEALLFLERVTAGLGQWLMSALKGGGLGLPCLYRVQQLTQSTGATAQ